MFSIIIMRTKEKAALSISEDTALLTFLALFTTFLKEDAALSFSMAFA